MTLKHWLYPIGLHLLMAVALLGGANWWIMGIVGLGTVLWSVGWGWSCWWHRDNHLSPVQLLIDSAWISMVIAWINIALIREAGFGESEHLPWIVWTLSLLWTTGGLWVSRERQPVYPMSPRERWGIGSLGIAMLVIIVWKSASIARPLDGYWYLKNADDPRHQLVPLRPANFWADTEIIGGIDSGAFAMTPTTPSPTLIADSRVNGRITLAVRGPIGSHISAKGKRAEVQRSVIEEEQEGSVDRYLESGVAAISIWADLQPGEQISLSVSGDRVYLMSSSDAVWALHGSGELRYTHYYQLLNQVENQQWANEMLTTRRFTWNQPPGWSPVLSTSNILVAPDLQGASCLFLHVILLVGLSSLQLTTVIAPRAIRMAWSVPALLMMVHALLMFEPGSQNFPDSLFAAAILGMWASIFQKEGRRFGWMGLLAQALRWPGAILGTLFILTHHWWNKPNSTDVLKSGLQTLWGTILVGVLIAGIAILTGDAEDLLFILYFETFPEHWHGNFNPIDLLKRIPSFFTLWSFYTGGMLILSLPFAFNSYNKSLTPILLTMIGYGLLLGTIDHHPSHYFLPLVACTGPIFVASSTCIPQQTHQRIFVGLGMIGVLMYLWSGVV